MTFAEKLNKWLAEQERKSTQTKRQKKDKPGTGPSS